MEKYLNETLSIEERVEDLLSKLTIEEKAEQMIHGAKGVERLGIHPYNWWNETLHGVARAGTATVFPQCIGLGATFNTELVHEIADICSTEGRAKNKESDKHGDYDIYKGLTYWTPNVNIFRDPRWGRGHETYGEDPYLTTQMGLAFTDGLQGHGKHLKSAACAKHFAVHSGPEELRHEFDAAVSKKDLRETYLPAFEALVREGNVEAVMGAYNRTNGEPCCGSKTLLNDILRDEWGFKGHVVSDCWAIRDFHEHHMVTKTPEESAALALKNGCDLNCGCTYEHLLKAYRKGMVTEEDINTAMRRLLTTWFKLGMFDHETEYDNIPYSVVACKAHREKAVEAARQSMVLLKNNGILPLDNTIKTIGVIGPNADSREALLGNYTGIPKKFVTVLEGIENEADKRGIEVMYSVGSHLWKSRTSVLAQEHDFDSEAMAVAEHSDVVVMCLGLDATIEGEQGDAGNEFGSGDKHDLQYPAIQRHLLEKVLETGTPVILVSMTGSAMDMRIADEKCAAIVQAWYPGGEGGTAVAELLFGMYSPSGKLPVTFYRLSEDLPAFTDYAMKNRTYRYFEGTPLYPFGYGLSYTAFEYGGGGSLDIADEIKVAVKIKNTGTMAGLEKVQLYAEPVDCEFTVPRYELRAYEPVYLEPGEEKEVILTVRKKDLMLVNDNGEKIEHKNGFTFYVSGGQPDSRTYELTGIKPIVFNVKGSEV
ncbi:MAG: glycoside hydrolase family 3 C-terminal domain-containing protein [Candidatus Ornithomonoglobus sp.]